MKRLALLALAAAAAAACFCAMSATAAAASLPLNMIRLNPRPERLFFQRMLPVVRSRQNSVPRAPA